MLKIDDLVIYPRIAYVEFTSHQMAKKVIDLEVIDVGGLVQYPRPRLRVVKRVKTRMVFDDEDFK